MLLLSEAAVEAAMSPEDAIEVTRHASRALARGKMTIPLRSEIRCNDAGGTALIMPRILTASATSVNPEAARRIVSGAKAGASRSAASRPISARVSSALTKRNPVSFVPYLPRRREQASAASPDQPDQRNCKLRPSRSTAPLRNVANVLRTWRYPLRFGV
ncbi:MAG: hypothetical protein AAFY56_16780 [Pseudomonadota bacterium]